MSRSLPVGVRPVADGNEVVEHSGCLQLENQTKCYCCKILALTRNLNLTRLYSKTVFRLVYNKNTSLSLACRNVSFPVFIVSHRFLCLLVALRLSHEEVHVCRGRIKNYERNSTSTKAQQLPWIQSTQTKSHTLTDIRLFNVPDFFDVLFL